jgi:adenylate cyclase
LAPPGGEVCDISVLFVDVRGFTSLAERLAPAEVAQRLNCFYALASEAIFKYDGTLDKFVGDQVMAFFGAPVHAKDHPQRAVRVALLILEGMSKLAQGDACGDTQDKLLRVGAGIASGEAFVGNVGGGAVTDYTVLGDTVNVAARLQGAAASGEILVTEETYRRVESEFPNTPGRELDLKGKSEPVHARVIAVKRT